MPHFTTEAVEAAAAVETPSAALRELLLESTAEKLPGIPENCTATPPVLFDIFLSHSSLDHVHVLGIYRLLRDRGYRVYLDQVCDPYLNRAHMTRATARVLRFRMAQSRSFFVATSSKAPQSKWLAWELGFMDGAAGKAAVLPIVPQRAPQYHGHEHFDLYPQVHDAGPGLSRPNNLHIHDRGLLIGTWEAWLALPREY